MRRERPDRVGLDLSRLARVRWRGLALRFVFGAGIAVVAGLVAMRFGPRWGGVFLAFPAILPASLTLIEEKEGRRKADADAKGGQLGGVGLAAFGAAAFALLPRAGAVPALTAALLAWIAVSAGLYLLLRRLTPSLWGEDEE